MSLINQKNIDYADKLAHLKACKALSIKGLRQLASIDAPIDTTFSLLQIFSQLLNIFKKPKYQLPEQTFSTWDNLKDYLKNNSTTLPNEAGAVKAKIDRCQFDTQQAKTLKKKFDTKLKCKVNSGKLII